MRTQQENEDHRRIDEEHREIGKVGLAEGVGEADRQAGDEGALQAAHAADDDNDEGRDEHGDIDARINAEERCGNDPGETGERPADGEGRGEEKRHVEADPHRRRRIIDAGTDHRAGARAGDEEP